jgi:hypothetical protein
MKLKLLQCKSSCKNIKLSLYNDCQKSFQNIFYSLYIHFRSRTQFSKSRSATADQMLRMKIQILVTFSELADIINFIKCNTEIYGILYVTTSGYLVNEL